MGYQCTAMVVDDDDHVRAFLIVLLRRLIDGRVSEARNGAEAVEIYEREHPQLVLLDVNMPIMNGATALRKLMEINPAVVVIMITSLATRQIVEEAADAGAVQFIRKDTSKEQIQEIIRETIETYVLPPAAES